MTSIWQVSAIFDNFGRLCVYATEHKPPSENPDMTALWRSKGAGAAVVVDEKPGVTGRRTSQNGQ
jgi:hypothetical protein